MQTLFVVLMICAGNLPREACTTKTARAYQAFIAPPGIVVCGIPALLTIDQTAVGPDEREYVKIRCKLQ